MRTQLRLILGALLIATAASAHEAAFPHEHGQGGTIYVYSGWNDVGSGVAAVRESGVRHAL